MNVSTFSRFGILLRLRRPHVASSRPLGRPSPGEVEAGGHGRRRSKRQSPPRVEKRGRKALSALGFPVLQRYDYGYLTHSTMHQHIFPPNIRTLFVGARGFFIALSVAWHARIPAAHHGASLGCERAPWHLLWPFKVTKYSKYSRGCFPRS